MDQAVLRKCCGVAPLIVTEYYPGTAYKMMRIKCPKCGMRTQEKRFFAAAAKEWNSPENAVVT